MELRLSPDPIQGWRLDVIDEAMLHFVGGVYTDLEAALAAIASRRDAFEHAAELVRGTR